MNILATQIEKIVLAPFVALLKQKEQVEGVVILGGLGRKRHFDLSSDIDIAVFVENRDGTINSVPQWLPQFEFQYRLPMPIGAMNEVTFNIHQYILSQEYQSYWDEAKKEAFYQGNIIYDRSGKVQQLLEEVLSYDEDERNRRLIEIIAQFPPYGDINPRRQSKRGFVHNGHDILNHCGEMIIEALFRYNKHFIAGKKWRLEASFHLPWTPDGYRHFMTEAMLIKSYTDEDIERRIEAFQNITRPLRQEILKIEGFPEDAYTYSCTFLWRRQLLETPFASRIHELLVGQNVGDSFELLQRLSGYLNYNLVSSQEEFLTLLDHDIYLQEIIGIEARKKISQTLRASAHEES